MVEKCSKLNVLSEIQREKLKVRIASVKSEEWRIKIEEWILNNEKILKNKRRWKEKWKSQRKK